MLTGITQEGFIHVVGCTYICKSNLQGTCMTLHAVQARDRLPALTPMSSSMWTSARTNGQGDIQASSPRVLVVAENSEICGGKGRVNSDDGALPCPLQMRFRATVENVQTFYSAYHLFIKYLPLNTPRRSGTIVGEVVEEVYDPDERGHDAHHMPAQRQRCPALVVSPHTARGLPVRDRGQVYQSCASATNPRARRGQRSQQPHIFTDYRIQSNSNNEITFELSAEPLLAALKSALNSPEVVLKLTKKNDHATWSFEVALSSTSGASVACVSVRRTLTRCSGSRMNITHDVRVTVLRPADVARIQEPLCPEPDVHVILPPLKVCLPRRRLNGSSPRSKGLRTVVERKAKLSDVVAVRCNKR